MIRSELVEMLTAAHPGLSIREIDRIVSTVFGTIAAQLASGGRIEIRGFGAFSVRDRQSRTGRNPRTGAPVEISEKRVPYFKPGKEIRARLNIAV